MHVLQFHSHLKVIYINLCHCPYFFSIYYYFSMYDLHVYFAFKIIETEHQPLLLIIILKLRFLFNHQGQTISPIMETLILHCNIDIRTTYLIGTNYSYRYYGWTTSNNITVLNVLIKLNIYIPSIQTKKVVSHL